MKRFTAILLVLMATIPSANGQPPSAQAATPRNTSVSADRQRLPPAGVLLEESVLADNTRFVVAQASQRAGDQRYQYLLGWVLPSLDPATIRMTAHFVSDNAVRAPRNAADHVVSPALELIAAAKELGRLPELEERIRRMRSDSERQQRARLAMLALLSIEGNDPEAALESILDLCERHRIQAFPALADRWPETLVAASALHHATLREPVEELLQRMLQQQVRTGRNNGPDSWDRLVFSLIGQLESANRPAAETADFGDPPALNEWTPVSARDFGTHGPGFPRAHWQRDGASVRIVSHHNNDYLYFRSPLTGSFAVECETTGFGYREAGFLAAGTWIMPAFTHDEYYAGHAGNYLPTAKISPRLSEITDWMRLRVRLTDRHCEFFIDGRSVRTDELPRGRDPWVAIRVPFFSRARIRDVCVTGTPVIPDVLQLSDNPELHGWTSYYGGGIGDQQVNDWRHETDSSGAGVIVGLSAESNAGTGKESLLQYQRPVLEDGDIEYEFLHEPGHLHVHPAVGRDVFLIRPGGIMLHRMTDAHFDWTGADPYNEQSLPPAPDTMTVAPPSLRPGEWNHVQLKFRGDRLDLFLNGQCVCHGILAAERNDRTFGLFHYDGESEVRVRQVRWRGGWPNSVPALNNQELRDPTTGQLDSSLSQLNARFVHDFAKSGLPLNLFQVQDQGADKYVEARSDGLHVNAEMTGSGYSRVCVTPLVVIEGDFDMTAEFEGLAITPTPHGLCNAMLQMAFTDEPISHHAASLSTIADPGRYPQRVVNHDLLQLKPFYMGLLDKRSEEIASGTLRLARRGNRIFSLLAPADSGIFRLIHTEESVTHASRFDGARLVTGLNSSVDGLSRVSIIWKSLSLRAQVLSGPAMEVSRKLEAGSGK